MEEAREQYDRQLGELYKRNRENAVKLREEAQKKKKKQAETPGETDPKI